MEKAEERLKRIKKEKKKYNKALKTATEEVKMANESLVDNLAFLEVTLQDLREHIIEHGVKEEYTNGENQKGYKESVEVKTYNNMIKIYISGVKTLNIALPKDAQFHDDEFEKFKNAF